jgi:hypothetical protein
MTYQVLGDDGQRLDAHAEVDSQGITFQSRGGSAAKGNVKNADYGPALRLLLSRLASSHIRIDRVWVDSMDVRDLPLEDRIILRSEELDADGSNAFTLMSRKMKKVGQDDERTGGNSTKKIRIQFSTTVDIPELETVLGLVSFDDDLQLLAEELNRVTAEHVWNAIEKLRDPDFKHRFGPSTDFDLVTDTGERFPPKAVFGIAATEALGFEVLPRKFASGNGTPCFRILKKAGFVIIPKSEPIPSVTLPTTPEDREWAEGNTRLVKHLRKERASGLAQAKKESFIRIHGRLTCEKCDMDPNEVYGEPHGEACIEVHHALIQVEHMGEDHRTKLEDLQCLCANCHRVEHRLLKAALAKAADTVLGQ